MKAKTNQERQKAYRKRLKDKGKKKLSLYLDPENVPIVKDYAKELEGKH